MIKRSSRLRMLILCSILTLDVVAAPSFAPGVTQQRSKNILDYYEQQEALEKLKSSQQEQQESVVDDKASSKDANAPEKASPAFVLRQVNTDKSDILSAEELRGITDKYIGKSVDIKILFKIVQEINDLYKTKSFPTAKAVLPPQKVKDGIVQIKLVEARIGKILVENNQSTKSSFIEDRVSLKGGDLVRVDNLDEDLTRFNRINDVRLRAELRPGEVFGTVDTIIKAQEPQRYQLSSYVDNAGAESVGKERVGTTFSDASLFGYRDPLSITGLYADGTKDGSISYSIPFTSYDTRIGFSYDQGAISVKQGALKDADVAGESKTKTLNLVQPFIVSPATKVEAFLTATQQESDTTFSGNTIAKTNVISYTAGASVLYIDDSGIWLMRNSITDGRERELGQSFNRYNGELTRMMRLDAGKSLTVRSAVQISSDKLLPSTQQFQVGGVSSVRGYSSGLLIGDDGYYVSTELDIPFYRHWNDETSALFGGQLQGALFIDHGAAFPYKGNGISSVHEDFLTSAGFGVVMGFDWGLSGRFDVGFPLAERANDNWNPKLHFLVQYNFF